MMQQFDDEDDIVHLTASDLTIPTPKIYDLTSEYDLGDETDQLIDGIDLENDEDVVDFLGAMLDG